MSTLQAINLKHPSSASNNIVLDSSGNAVVAGTLQANGVTGSVYPLVRGTAVASTSGTAIDFTGIPSWVRRLTVLFRGVSTSGANAFLFQIGAGSVATSGYQSNGLILQSSTAVGGERSTSGFVSSNNGLGSADSYAGSAVITTLGSNDWVCNGLLVRSSGTYQNLVFAGSITLGGTLDRVRITTVGGTDTFDAGSINILYE